MEDDKPQIIIGLLFELKALIWVFRSSTLITVHYASKFSFDFFFVWFI